MIEIFRWTLSRNGKGNPLNSFRISSLSRDGHELNKFGHEGARKLRATEEKSFSGQDCEFTLDGVKSK